MRLVLLGSIATLLLCWQPAMAGTAENDFSITSLTAGDGEKSCLVTDADGDHSRDLVLVNEALGRLMIWSGNTGLPSGRPSVVVELPTMPTSLATGDLDGDGLTDLAVAHHEQDFVSILYGAPGTASFQAVQRVRIETDPHSHQIGIADIDGDERPDLLVDSRDSHGLFLLTNLGGRSFDEPGIPIDVGGTPYRGFTLGDFDNDGMKDIAVPNASGVGLMRNLSRGEPRFRALEEIPFAGPFSVMWADFNDDDHLDLFVASVHGETGLAIYAGDGEGGFDFRQRQPMADGATALVTGDINGDGFADVAAAGWNSDLLFILGSGDSAEMVSPPLSGLRNPWGLCSGDLDADGRDDFVVTDGQSGRVNIYRWVEQSSAASE